MSETIVAIVEKGVLRPTRPLQLADGTRVNLQVVPQDRAPDETETAAQPATPRSSPAEVLAAIAALPMEPGPDFSGRDHDRILYIRNGER